MLWSFSAVVFGALAAVPGYFVAAFEEERLPGLSMRGRWWVRASLGMGGLGSAVAAPLVLFFGRWMLLFPVGTVAGCIYLWRRAEKAWTVSEERGLDSTS